MTTRGGKRPGAGRKAVLTYEQMLDVGAECERRWRLAVDASSLDARRKENPQTYGYYDDLRQSHPSERRARAKQGTYARQDMTERVTEAIKNDRRLPDGAVDYDDDDNPIVPRVLDGREVRAWRAWRAIFEAIASEETARRGVLITVRRVQECLKKFRELQQSINE